MPEKHPQLPMKQLPGAQSDKYHQTGMYFFFISLTLAKVTSKSMSWP